MNKHILDKFFNPQAIAIVGASPREGSIGHYLIRNLQADNFPGTIYPINPNHQEIMGLTSYPSLAAIAAPVDLAVIAIPIKGVADVIRDCGRAGIPAAIIISAGGKEVGDEGLAIEADIKAAAKEGNVRYLGPNCMGIICPGAKLNASFAAHSAMPGSLALLSQSGAICSATLDWAAVEKIGFSHFVSIGSMADLDFGDMIDYLGNDQNAKSIIIYMENLTNHRKFMSAARSVSRVKPIIVAKAGRSQAAARAAASHTGALAGQDDAYNALFRRAGIIRVDTVAQLFSCAEALGKMNRPLGGNVAIITNAGGPGVMAVDAFSKWDAEPVELSEETKAKLSELLPPHWSHGNPIDILGDAPPERYEKALQICLQAPEVSGAIMILSPQAMTDPTAVAQEIIQELKIQAKPIFAVWMGAQDVAEGIRILNEGGIPTFHTPEEAVDTFMQMYSYTKNLALLQETPAQSPQEIQVNYKQARSFIDACLQRRLYTLSEIEAKAIFSAYGIPVNRTVSVSSAEAAAEAAEEIGFPVVAKIHSYDISHKSDVDGVRVNLKTPQEVMEAYEQITGRARELRPEAKIMGVTVQNMIPHLDLELILGCKRDPQFGPLLLFGMGGVLTEIYRDTAVALPPLNLQLARRIITYPRIYKILQGYRNIPPTNLEALTEMLVRLSQLVSDFSEITELDINPLLIDKTGRPMAVDGRIIIEPAQVPAPRHLIIAPYPNKYESSWLLKDGTPVKLRPMIPEDEKLVEGLLRNCSEETLYFRYFNVLKSFPHSFLIRFTQNDYDRELGLAAIGVPPGPEVMMGVGRLVMTPDRDTAEFAGIVADPWHSKGLGEKLIEEIINIARDYGVKLLWGEILATNEPMLGLVRKLGFTVNPPEEGLRRVEMIL
jgi:acetyltransferase